MKKTLIYVLMIFCGLLSLLFFVTLFGVEPFGAKLIIFLFAIFFGYIAYYLYKKNSNNQSTTNKNEGELITQLSNTQKEIEQLKAVNEKLTSQISQYSQITDADSYSQKVKDEAIQELKNTKATLNFYQKAIVAIKNKIDGYGDEYIVPTYNLLDDLADNFSFAEAGIKLKEARMLSKKMVKENSAATCDYVEQNRKETAVRFVTDAFNGKVDSVLSRVKADNIGKLKQEINDAFNLVNLNGKAFREARINEEYLNSRQQELEWGVKAYLLREQEKEEQRRIKEQIREEEKARREYEKAIKDAQIEEDKLNQMAEKIRSEMELASSEQKSKYENQLAELMIKLKEAEEKNKRALSMAQQTRTGHVYIISNTGSFGENIYKIGMTRRLEPLDRVKELGDASVPFPFDIHAMIYSEDAPKLEKELHKTFVFEQVNKVNVRKEFFRIGITQIKETIDSFNINASWTLTALAAEYKETMALEEAIKNNKELAKDWAIKNLKVSDDSLFISEPIDK